MTTSELIDFCYAQRNIAVPWEADPIKVSPEQYRAIVWLAQTDLGIKPWQLRQPIDGHRLLGRPIQIIHPQEAA